MADHGEELNGLREAESLPPELRALHRQMLEDGAAWRAGLPSAERLAHTVGALLAQVSTQVPGRPSVETATMPASRAPAPHSHTLPGAGRLSWLGALLAAALVVTLMGALLHNRAAGRSMNQPGAHQATATTAATPTGQWESLAHYASSAPGSYALIIAPGDRRVAYHIVSTAGGTPQIVRTDDGGATWHDVALPGVPDPRVRPPQGGYNFGLAVSPLDAHVVFLAVEVVQHATSVCAGGPTGAVLRGGRPLYAGLGFASGGGVVCRLRSYYSTDGGNGWHDLRLPVPGVLGSDTATPDSVTEGVVRAQGARLYSLVRPFENEGFSTPARLVTSVDGGASWEFIDAALADQSEAVADYLPAANSATLFALTSPPGFVWGGSSWSGHQEIWRTDDSGASWRQVGTLTYTSTPSILVAVDGRPDRAQPLVYVGPSASAVRDAGARGVTPQDLHVSADGGRTWQAAVTDGLPAPAVSYSGASGMLDDGSIVMPFAQTSWEGSADTLSADTLYAWKYGVSAWHQVSPPTDGRVCSLLVTPTGPGGSAAIWATMCGADTMTVERYTLGPS